MTEPAPPTIVRAPDVVKMLNVRFAWPEWALFEQVTANGGRRYADCVAMNLWESRGQELHGFEVKVSRADWLRELRKPEKAEESVFRFCDRWWLVAPRGAVKDGELPSTWGLLEVVGDRLVQKTQAPKLTPVEARRPLLACIVRRAIEWRAEHVHKDAVSSEVDRRVAEQLEHEVARRLGRTDDAAERLTALQARIDAFEAASGISLDGWQKPKELGEAASALISNRDILERQAAYTLKAAKELVELVAKLPPEQAKPKA